MIALALACGPSLVIADEPTTALDVVMQAQVLQLLERLRERLGLALILISHDLGVLAETCDRIAIMYAGQIVEIGPVGQVFGDPQHPYTKRLLEMLPVIGGERGSPTRSRAVHPTRASRPRAVASARAARTRRTAASRIRRCARWRRASAAACHFAPWSGVAAGRAARGVRARGGGMSASLMEVRDLAVEFRVGRGVARAVDGVSLDWRQGEILGVVGESGCGKSTLARAHARPGRGRRGEVALDGQAVDGKGETPSSAAASR